MVTAIGLAEGAGLFQKWMVQYEHTSPEGSKKLSITINRQTASLIVAHQGDALTIDVFNGLGHENLAIQWERIRQMEGPQGLILPGNTGRYRLAADQLGTCPFYASSILQREAGLRGSIQVLPPVVGKKAVPFKEGASKAGKLPPPVKGSGEVKGSKRP